MIKADSDKTQFEIFNASHIEFPFISTIFYMFAQSWVMFYFIGAGKTIKETILYYNFDKSIYDKVMQTCISAVDRAW